LTTKEGKEIVVAELRSGDYFGASDLLQIPVSDFNDVFRVLSTSVKSWLRHQLNVWLSMLQIL
jgi:CRP-like cAMP-binding protein